MKKLKLQKLIRHKLISETSPKEIAMRYIIIGLKRDSQIINKDLICSRLGISNSISDSMVNECIREIKTIINKLEERMNNERET